jgi:hypothetical protein
MVQAGVNWVVERLGGCCILLNKPYSFVSHPLISWPLLKQSDYFEMRFFGFLGSFVQKQQI